MSKNNFIKNIISKDKQTYFATINSLMDSSNSGSTKEFEELTQNSDFIFPNVKQKIIHDFVNMVNKSNISRVFEFTNIYSEDFSDLIIKSWLKVACDDITDKILELFEFGTNEQKAYCALYFSFVLDPLALDFLKQYAYSENKALRTNCAKALKSFGDKTVLDDMIEKIKNNTLDDFEKLQYFEFIIAYKSKEALRFAVENANTCCFFETIILDILDTFDFEDLKNNLKNDELLKVFRVILESLPENASLNCVSYYQVFDFIKYIKNLEFPYAHNLLLKAKADFSEYLNNEMYHFEMDKFSLDELKKIVDFLNSLNILPLESKIKQELKNSLLDNDKAHYTLLLNIIKSYNLSEIGQYLTDLINNFEIKNESLLLETLETLKTIQDLKPDNSGLLGNVIKKSVILNIQNENIKQAALSYL